MHIRFFMIKYISDYQWIQNIEKCDSNVTQKARVICKQFVSYLNILRSRIRSLGKMKLITKISFQFISAAEEEMKYCKLKRMLLVKHYFNFKRVLKGLSRHKVHFANVQIVR